mmetsp:Transcript_21956/g.56276  ORF Transcript_21956/g.56276 Transcript_21956/m.56276 type:complete len:280 (+) Transcript_21956:1236-2075(+)
MALLLQQTRQLVHRLVHVRAAPAEAHRDVAVLRQDERAAGEGAPKLAKKWHVRQQAKADPVHEDQRLAAVCQAGAGARLCAAHPVMRGADVAVAVAPKAAREQHGVRQQPDRLRGAVKQQRADRHVEGVPEVAHEAQGGVVPVVEADAKSRLHLAHMLRQPLLHLRPRNLLPLLVIEAVADELLHVAALYLLKVRAMEPSSEEGPDIEVVLQGQELRKGVIRLMVRHRVGAHAVVHPVLPVLVRQERQLQRQPRLREVPDAGGPAARGRQQVCGGCGGR